MKNKWKSFECDISKEVEDGKDEESFHRSERGAQSGVNIEQQARQYTTQIYS